MRELLKLLPVFIVLAAWTYVGQDYPFFWDTVQLGSKHAHHFYQNNLQWTPLPAEIDSGHPPVFGFYIASIWTLFGKTLPAAHWAMFPFLCGIAWLVYRLGRRIGESLWALWLLPLVFFDPVLAGQSTLVGPDLVLVFCFLWAVEGLLNRRNPWVAASILGLCAISMRGMMTAGALFAWQIVARRYSNRFFSPDGRAWQAFIPGFIFAAWFLWWHQKATGWTGYHAGSPWAPAFEPAQGKTIIKNILIVGWRWTDLGRIFEWAAVFFIIYREKWINRVTGSNLALTILLLLSFLILFLSPSALLYKNLSAHRYFLPLFICMHLFAFHLLARSFLPDVKKKAVFVVLWIGLLTGNCWIYPRGISMDWDSTLAHIPYHRLRSQMVADLEEQKIDFDRVGTSFPNINSGENLLLNGDRRQFSEKDLANNQFVLASNVFNDFSDEDFRVLDQHWRLIKTSDCCGVWIKLYKHPEGQTRFPGSF